MHTETPEGRIAAGRKNLTIGKWIFCLVSILTLVLPRSARCGERSSDKSLTEHWYRVEISGQSAGWVMEREDASGDSIVSESHSRLELRRGSAETTIEMESRFVEDKSGRPLTAWTRQKLGTTPIESFFAFQQGTGAARGTVLVGQPPNQESMPWPKGEWLTPAASRLKARQEAAGGSERFSLRLLDPSLGLEPVVVEWILEASDEEMPSDAGPVAGMGVSRWRQTSSFAPGISSLLYIDADGLLVRSETSLMGLRMTQTLSTREAVSGASAQADGPTPEILVQTFVRPDRPIERPRRSRRAVYELTLTEGELPALPSTGAQTAEQAEGGLRVTMELGSSPQLEDIDRALFLRSTTYLRHDDPELRKLLKNALPKPGQGIEKDTDRTRAESLRSFVADYLVVKDLNTVLGTATDVARSRSGDCTEHAVLLAALLRGAGIPSRVVSGLIYVDSFIGQSEIFGYHMWTQALIDSRWLDLDATLPGTAFDAAHIAIGTSALDADSSVMKEMARMLPLLGRLRIRVLQVEHR